MSQSLSRWQATLLGAVVLLAAGLIAFGLVRVGGKSGLWADTADVTVRFAEAHDLAPGTPVRIRGVDAGQVVAVEYPDHDGPDAAVTVRMKVDAKYASRLYADATAQVYSTGLLGSKVIAIQPGTPTSGPLADGRLAAKDTPDFAQVAAKLSATADEVSGLVRDARTGNGTLGKLIRDDKLYTEMTDLATDTRAMVRRAGGTLDTVEKKADDVEHLVQDGRSTLRSVKQGTDAVQSLPVIRSYVTDAAKLLVRPECRKTVWQYDANDLFEPGTAILHEPGREHLARLAAGLRDVRDSKAELAVAALCDPKAKDQTSESAAELTKKQAEAVVAFLKGQKALKTGWFSSRKATPVGLGQGPHPVVPDGPTSPSYVQVVLFFPQ